MGTLSSWPPAPGAQLAGPSEQFATVGGGPRPPLSPTRANKEQFGPKLTHVGTGSPLTSGPTEREESSLHQHSVQFIRLLGANQVYWPEQKKEKETF